MENLTYGHIGLALLVCTFIFFWILKKAKILKENNDKL